jgi:hypothetical protein
MLSVVKLSAIILNVVMLSVVAPLSTSIKKYSTKPNRKSMFYLIQLVIFVIENSFIIY